MKKIFTSFLVMILVFGGFMSTSHAADPTGWQLIDVSYISTGISGYLDGAEGGSAKICIKDVSYAIVSIYDNDNGSSFGATKIASNIGMWRGDCYTFNVAPYVDGSDNDAEFIVQTSRDLAGTVKFELWD